MGLWRWGAWDGTAGLPMCCGWPRTLSSNESRACTFLAFLPSRLSLISPASSPVALPALASKPPSTDRPSLESHLCFFFFFNYQFLTRMLCNGFFLFWARIWWCGVRSLYSVYWDLRYGISGDSIGVIANVANKRD